MTATVTYTKTMTCVPSDLTVEVLRAFIANEKDECKVNVRVSDADQPGELGQITVSVGGML